MHTIFFLQLLLSFLFEAITNAALDLSPVLLGVLFTLLLLCFAIFAKVYCFRSSSASGSNLHSDEKHANNINYTKDEVCNWKPKVENESIKDDSFVS